MSTTATLTRNNQITVPKSIRQILGVEAGQKLVFHANQDSVTIKKEKTVEEVSQAIQALITDEMRANWQPNVGKTAGEIREEWLASPAAKEYYHIGEDEHE